MTKFESWPLKMQTMRPPTGHLQSVSSTGKWGWQLWPLPQILMRKKINNIYVENTKHSGLCSDFSWTWTSIPLASSNEGLWWLPRICFYFNMHKLRMSMEYLWSWPSSLHFSIFSSFSIVTTHNFYNHKTCFMNKGCGYILEVGIRLEPLDSVNTRGLSAFWD